MNYITFTLEFVGVFLAFIEIKFPSIADKIEHAIDSSEVRTKLLRAEISTGKTSAAVFTIFIIAALTYALYALGFFNHVETKQFETIAHYLVMLFPVTVVIVLLGLGMILFGELIDWLNAFSDGRALGTLGVSIGFMGLLGEIYQLFF